MAWTVEIDPSARKTLKKIDPQNANRILKFLFERVAYLSDPRSIGEARTKIQNTLEIPCRRLQSHLQSRKRDLHSYRP